MRKTRILEIKCEDNSIFYPQCKWLFWWWDYTECCHSTNHIWSIKCKTLEEAQKVISKDEEIPARVIRIIHPGPPVGTHH